MHPGYIEFDEPTKMAVTWTCVFDWFTLKIWSLADYRILYSFKPVDAAWIKEIWFSDGLVMTISKLEDWWVSFEIYDPVKRLMLRDLRVWYDASKPLSCVEFFSQYLVFKVKNEDAHIIDILEGTSIKQENSASFEPHSFVYIEGKWILVMYS